MWCFPDERSRDLLVGDWVLVIGAPLRCERTLHGGAAPRRIPDDQININRVSAVVCEEITTPNVSFNFSATVVFLVMNQSGQLVPLLLQFLDIPWGKLIQISQVKAECGDPASRGINVHSVQTAKDLP